MYTDKLLFFWQPNSDGALDSKTKSDERRHTFKKENVSLTIPMDCCCDS